MGAKDGISKATSEIMQMFKDNAQAMIQANNQNTKKVIDNIDENNKKIDEKLDQVSKSQKKAIVRKSIKFDVDTSFINKAGVEYEKQMNLMKRNIEQASAEIEKTYTENQNRLRGLTEKYKKIDLIPNVVNRNRESNSIEKHLKAMGLNDKIDSEIKKKLKERRSLYETKDLLASDVESLQPKRNVNANQVNDYIDTLAKYNAVLLQIQKIESDLVKENSKFDDFLNPETFAIVTDKFETVLNLLTKADVTKIKGVIRDVKDFVSKQEGSKRVDVIDAKKMNELLSSTQKLLPTTKTFNQEWLKVDKSILTSQKDAEEFAKTMERVEYLTTRPFQKYYATDALPKFLKQYAAFAPETDYSLWGKNRGKGIQTFIGELFNNDEDGKYVELKQMYDEVVALRKAAAETPSTPVPLSPSTEKLNTALEHTVELEHQVAQAGQNQGNGTQEAIDRQEELNKKLEQQNELEQKNLKFRQQKIQIAKLASTIRNEGNVTAYDGNDFKYSKEQLYDAYYYRFKLSQMNLGITPLDRDINQLHADIIDAEAGFIALFETVEDYFSGRFRNANQIKNGVKSMHDDFVDSVNEILGSNMVNITTEFPVFEHNNKELIAQYLGQQQIKQQEELNTQLEETAKRKLYIANLDKDNETVKKVQSAIDKQKEFNTALEKTLKISRENALYHAGALSMLNKADTLGVMENTRDTGHYGTGHYLVANKEQSLDSLDGWNNKPYTSVDKSFYTLLKETQTGSVHKFLKLINQLTSGKDIDINELYEQYKNIYTEEGHVAKSFKEFNEKIQELIAYRASRIGLDDRRDSASTVFNKWMGYEGVDTSNTPYDNTMYGSVIYDLKEESILQANITDELQKQGEMLEKIAINKSLYTEEDEQIAQSIKTANESFLLSQEVDKIFDSTKLKEYQSELQKVEDRLNTVDEIITNTYPYTKEDGLQRVMNDHKTLLNFFPQLSQEDITSDAEETLNGYRDSFAQATEEKEKLIVKQNELLNLIDLEKSKMDEVRQGILDEKSSIEDVLDIQQKKFKAVRAPRLKSTSNISSFLQDTTGQLSIFSPKPSLVEEANKQIEGQIGLFDNLAKLEEKNNSLLLYHNSHAAFDNFNMDYAGKNQGTMLGKGAYLGLNSTKYNDVNTGILQTEWYANIVHPFIVSLSDKIQGELSSFDDSELQKIHDTYLSKLSQEMQTYYGNLLKGLQGYDVIDALEQLSSELKLPSMTDIFAMLGYDSVVDGENNQINVFDPKNVVRANDIIRDLNGVVLTIEEANQRSQEWLRLTDKIKTLYNEINNNAVDDTSTVKQYDEQIQRLNTLLPLIQEYQNKYSADWYGYYDDIDKRQIVEAEDINNNIAKLINIRTNMSGSATSTLPLQETKQEVKEVENLAQAEKKASDEAIRLSKEIAKIFNMRTDSAGFSKLLEDVDFLMSQTGDNAQILEHQLRSIFTYDLASDRNVYRSVMPVQAQQLDELRTYLKQTAIRMTSDIQAEFGDSWKAALKTFKFDPNGSDATDLIDELTNKFGLAFNTNSNASVLKTLFDYKQYLQHPKMDDYYKAFQAQGFEQAMLDVFRGDNSSDRLLISADNTEVSLKKDSNAAEDASVAMENLARQKDEVTKANQNLAASAQNTAENVKKEGSTIKDAADNMANFVDAPKGLIDNLQQRVDTIKDQFGEDSKAKYTIKLDAQGDIQSASVTYMNDALKQSVTETYKWHQANEEIKDDYDRLILTGTTIVDNEIAAAKAAEDAARKLKESQTKYQSKLATINPAFANTKEYKEVKDAIDGMKVDTLESDIAKVETAFNSLNKVVNEFKTNVKNSSSLDPVFNALERIKNVDNEVASIELKFKKIGLSAEESANKFQRVRKIIEQLKQVDLTTPDGMTHYGELLKEYIDETTRLNNEYKISKEKMEALGSAAKTPKKAVQELTQAYKELSSAYSTYASHANGKFDANMETDAINLDAALKNLNEYSKKATEAGVSQEELNKLQDEFNNKISTNLSKQGTRFFDVYLSKIAKLKQELTENGTLTEETAKRLDELYSRASAYKDISNQKLETMKGGNFTDNINQWKEYIQNIRKIAPELNQVLDSLNRESKINQVEFNLGQLEELDVKTPKIVTAITAIRDALNELYELQSNPATSPEIIKEKQVEIIKQASKAMNELYTNKNSDKFVAGTEGTVSNINELEDAIRKYAKEQFNLEKVIGKTDNGSDEMSMTFKKTNGEVVKITGNINNLKTGLNATVQTQNGANKSISTFGSILQQVGKYFAVYFTGYSMVTRVFSALKNGFNVLKEFDDSLVVISYTMDVTRQQLDKIGDSAVNTAKKLSASLEDTMDVYKIYANMKTTSEELEKLATPTLVLSNLSGVDSETAADQIQAVIQQFDYAAEQSQHIVDVYDKISANIAVDYTKLNWCLY